MRDKTKILNEHKKKIDIIKKHNKRYFVDDNPKINDYEYDQLKKELNSLKNIKE